MFVKFKNCNRCPPGKRRLLLVQYLSAITAPLRENNVSVSRHSKPTAKPHESIGFHRVRTSARLRHPTFSILLEYVVEQDGKGYKNDGDGNEKDDDIKSIHKLQHMDAFHGVPP